MGKLSDLPDPCENYSFRVRLALSLPVEWSEGESTHEVAKEIFEKGKKEKVEKKILIFSWDTVTIVVSLSQERDNSEDMYGEPRAVHEHFQKEEKEVSGKRYYHKHDMAVSLMQIACCPVTAQIA